MIGRQRRKQLALAFTKSGKYDQGYGLDSEYGLTCSRFLYQSKLEIPWVEHTPFAALRTLFPSSATPW